LIGNADRFIKKKWATAHLFIFLPGISATRLGQT